VFGYKAGQGTTTVEPPGYVPPPEPYGDEP